MQKFTQLLLFGGVCIVLLIVLWPVAWHTRFVIRTRHWETQIRQHQDPVALQAWATNLLATYSESNVIGVLPVTNKPPPGFPVAISPDVALMNDTDWGGGYYVELMWPESPFGGRWGLKIGETNYVRDLPDKWIPGVYFFRGS
jgi:hypothetical protein